MADKPKKPKGWPKSNCAYKIGTDPFWTWEVDGWEWIERKEEGDWVKTGTCPRCGHQMWDVLPEETRTLREEMLTKTRSGGGSVAATLLFVECGCGDAHGREDDKTGCGFGGNVGQPGQERKS